MALPDVEITALRSELVQHSSQILTVTQIAVTASVTIIGFGLSQPAPNSGFIVMLPLLILWPSFGLITNRRLNVLRIATYLRAYGDKAFRYETRLRHLRTNEVLRWPSFHRGIARAFVILGFACVGISVLLLMQRQEFLVVPAIGAFMWSWFAWRIWHRLPSILMGSKGDDDMFVAWQKTDEETTEAAEDDRPHVA